MKTYGSAATSWLFNINQQWVFHWCGKYCTHPSKAQRSMFTTLCKVEIFRSLTFISLSLSTFVYLCLNWKFMIFERPPVPAQGWEFTNCIYNSNFQVEWYLDSQCLFCCCNKTSQLVKCENLLKNVTPT